MFGFWVIDKPPGWTSRAIVNAIRRAFRGVKLGHAGTLDPIASGVLLVAAGPATRLVPFLQELPKTYVADFRLGCQSPTDDIESEVTPVAIPSSLTRSAAEGCLPRFLGTIDQTPPAYSAVKVAGERAYRLARRGETVSLAAKRVTIYRIELRSFAAPELSLEVCCGSGTYIRALGRDLAAALSTAAVMTNLRRTAIGPFSVEAAISATQFDRGLLEQSLRPPIEALPGWSRALVAAEHREALGQGRPLDWGELTHVEKGDASPVDRMAAVDEGGSLIAILRRRSDGRWWPERNFCS